MGNKLERSYTSLKKTFVNKEFYSLFLDEIEKELTKYYGSDEALYIMALLSDNVLKVVNAEVFFDPSVKYSDPALKILKRVERMGDFTREYMFAIKEIQKSGVSTLNLPLFFVAAGQFDPRLPRNFVEKVAEELFVFLATSKSEKNIITFQVLDSPLFYKVAHGIHAYVARKYYTLTNKFITGFLKVMNDPKYSNLNFPRLELINSIYKDDRSQVELYLKDIFMTRTKIVRDATKDVPSFDKDSLELRAAISILKSAKSKFFFDEDKIIEKVIHISKTRPFKAYIPQREAQKRVQFIDYHTYYKASKHTCIALDTWEYLGADVQGEIEINCSQVRDQDSIENLITSAARVLLIKNRLQNPPINPKMLITLANLNFFSTSFISSVQKIQETLNSQYNREFFIGIRFQEGFATNTISDEPSKYVRVISDIHCDVNANKGYTYNFGNDFVINCGDTAGKYTDVISWVTANMQRGTLVTGNHLGYEYPSPELGKFHQENSRSTQAKKVRIYLNRNSNIKLLGPRSVFEHGGMTFIGCTLYSNLELYGKENFELCKKTAAFQINDFRRCSKVRYKEVAPYSIDDHLGNFRYQRTELCCLLRKLKDKSVIVVTHFAPLPFSVAPEYNGDPLSAYFVNDLRNIFKEHSNIRLWCHGHTHNKFDYIYRRKNNKGKWCETRVVCNPFGYFNENNASLPNNYGTRIKVSDIKSIKPWTVILKDQIQKGEIKVYTEE